MFEVRRYVTESGVDVIGEWLSGLNDLRARAKINVRIARLAVGSFGDCKLIQRGLRELRIDYGPGYRVYFARTGGEVVLLLCGGDKRSQSADVKRALEYLADYKRRIR